MEPPMNAMSTDRLTPELSKILGWLWVLEGLGPKLLAVNPEELNLVERTGLWVRSPAWTLKALGVTEVLGGLWLLTGVAPRGAAAMATVVGGRDGVGADRGDI
jgi:uncharacterized membrane protein YphA (DoxX/SURF4 family)